MTYFLFQPYPMEGIQVQTNKNIHSSRSLKIIDDEISYDFQLNIQCQL